jgi:hypothetical protein
MKSKCACGHPIRFEFVVTDSKRPGHKRVIGSTCINHYQSYRPEECGADDGRQRAHGAGDTGRQSGKQEGATNGGS